MTNHGAPSTKDPTATFISVDLEDLIDGIEDATLSKYVRASYLMEMYLILLVSFVRGRSGFGRDGILEIRLSERDLNVIRYLCTTRLMEYMGMEVRKGRITISDLIEEQHAKTDKQGILSSAALLQLRRKEADSGTSERDDLIKVARKARDKVRQFVCGPELLARIQRHITAEVINGSEVNVRRISPIFSTLSHKGPANLYTELMREAGYTKKKDQNLSISERTLSGLNTDHRPVAGLAILFMFYIIPDIRLGEKSAQLYVGRPKRYTKRWLSAVENKAAVSEFRLAYENIRTSLLLGGFEVPLLPGILSKPASPRWEPKQLSERQLAAVTAKPEKKPLSASQADRRTRRPRDA